MSLFAKLNHIQTSIENTTSTHKAQLFSTYKKANELPSFIQDYLVSRMSLGYSPSTIQRYIYDFYFFFSYVKRHTDDPAFSASSIQLVDFLQLEKAGIQHYISYLALEVENEPRTINRKLSALQSLFDYLIKEGLTATNPVVGVERPKLGKREPVYLTQKEVKQLLNAIRATEDHHVSLRQKMYQEKLNSRDFLVFYLLISTGLRISELSSLKLKQVNVERRTLSVRGKGNKERTIPLATETINMIEDYLRSLPKDARPQYPDDALFIGYDFKKGSYIKSVSLNALQKMIQRQIKRASQTIASLQNKQITAHKLRHTFATALIENGVDVLTIQSLLGHESIATTQVYAHVQDRAREQAIEQLTYS
ncbi:tyrosine-type recombinase/integrase [Halalkalibacter nanhaiisediminis]|uniref:Integrase/recombinase XerC n=1 Tax=Halalkalibacter nanhaiisediminis TaxID=688079 RepID=A0A562QQE1_9BACI|nr:tyrosine-type recombinase/integrase [Halalkalibacter nanhaiisediminis]TWI58981.1 integrase/recombinase XerC [Halalkalibacter nanhaiisediminis]